MMMPVLGSDFVDLLGTWKFLGHEVKAIVAQRAWHGSHVA